MPSTRTARSAHPTRRLTGVIVAVSALLAIGAATTAAVSAAALAEAGSIEIDGIALTAEEEDAALLRAERQGATASTESAVELLRDELALFSVARDLEATDIVRPSDITELLDDVNGQRRAAAARGDVVYGPIEYDASSFYGKSLTDIRQAAIERLEAGAGEPISDDDVRERFDAERSEWAASMTTYQLDALSGTGAIPTTTDWDALLGSSSKVPSQRSYTARDLDSGVVGPDTVAELAAAADGDVIGPFAEAGGWTVLRLVSRTVDTESAFQHYRSRIRAVLVEEQLDTLIAQARSAQHVTAG